MENNKSHQITVDQAAAFLNVTARSVINYIKAKEIEAIKVGKIWFVNAASLDSFKQRYGFKVAAAAQVSNPPEGTEPIEIKKDSVLSSSKSSGNIKRKEAYPVGKLRLFQIAKEVLSDFDAPSFFPKDRSDLGKKVLQLKTEALEYLGAGFYSYGSRNKVMLYNRSREKVGGILSLIYFYKEENVGDSTTVAKGHSSGPSKNTINIILG